MLQVRSRLRDYRVLAAARAPGEHAIVDNVKILLADRVCSALFAVELPLCSRAAVLQCVYVNNRERVFARATFFFASFFPWFDFPRYSRATGYLCDIWYKKSGKIEPCERTNTLLVLLPGADGVWLTETSLF